MKIITTLILLTLFSTSRQNLQPINPLDYFPLKEGIKWNYNGKYLNSNNQWKFYNFFIEVQNSESDGITVNYILYRSSYGDGPNDEPEFIELNNQSLTEVSSGLTLLRHDMKVGDKWGPASKYGKKTGTVEILKMNYEEKINNTNFNNCIKILLRKNDVPCIEEIVFSKGHGMIKMERFATANDYQIRHAFSKDSLKTK